MNRRGKYELSASFFFSSPRVIFFFEGTRELEDQRYCLFVSGFAVAPQRVNFFERPETGRLRSLLIF